MKSKDDKAQLVRKMKKRIKTINRRARAAGVDGQLRDIDPLYLHMKQMGQCHWCKINLSGVFDIDHIVPYKRGGNNTL